MIDPRAIALIEGFEPEAYLDQLADPPVWTIVFGTTAAAGVSARPFPVFARADTEENPVIE